MKSDPNMSRFTTKLWRWRQTNPSHGASSALQDTPPLLKEDESLFDILSSERRLPPPQTQAKCKLVV
ncbi:hypothetical protein E2C01_033898 [Portunus trituberculatus]|uniref:Uncharacterized protein n=1 Tax=Portunus trituberculatus TaxID=210409 RepID=A0A5B7F1D4_PORTR|nr:hypothetical protein [Portunus trituberculatus]